MSLVSRVEPYDLRQLITERDVASKLHRFLPSLCEGLHQLRGRAGCREYQDAVL